ncbi:crossover junction endodeoxyribonuclease RuvC [bacterium]|nr:crossover junction endodeoxyribonuclease RuvC [bacterium]
MRTVLGLDLSMTSAGWFLQDGKKKYSYGSFKTKPKDGIDIKRLMLQRDRIVNLFNEYKIDHIGIEQPFLRSFNTEKLYALHQFILEVCYTRHINVVYITPAQIKAFATGSGKAQKNEIVFKTKKVLNLKEQRINDDECDAYWVGVIAKKFWEFYYGEVTEEELTPQEKYIILKTKTKRPGLIKKKNDSFHIF